MGRKGLAFAGLLFLSLFLAALVLRTAIAPPGEQAGEAFRFVFKDRALAERLAADALKRTPIDATAARTLAIVREMNGQPEQAARLYALAGQLSRRDQIAQGWLMSRSIAAGDFPQAIVHADAVLRSSEDRGELALVSLVNIAPRQGGVQALTAALAERPAWRRRFLYATADRGDLAATTAIYRGLARSDAPPDTAEVSRYLERLVSLGRYEEAHEAWRDLSAGGVSSPKPYDGAFEGRDAALPFNWIIPNAPGAIAEMIAPPTPVKGKALHVLQDGYAKDTIARQLLVLPPGAYVLAGHARADDSAAAGLLEWVVICRDGAGEPILRLRNGASPGWTAFRQGFTIPEGCAAQSLELRPALHDHRRRADVWYDELRIERVAGGGVGAP